jgi:anti-sigma B factor antagonist
MAPANVRMQVRKVDPKVSIIDISGEVTSAAETTLMDAYGDATAGGARVIVLNFSGLEYMNSSGIGLLVTLLVRANRQKQRLMSFGLSEHYRHVLTITRLDEAIAIHAGEREAVAAGKAL